MEKKPHFNEYQQATSVDFNRLGDFTEAAIDRVVREGITDRMRFEGLNVGNPSALQVVVGPGSFYQEGRVYRNELDQTIALTGLLPLATKKVLALVVYGTDADTDVEPRTFLRNVTTREAEARAVATTKSRVANISTVSGTEASEPRPPAVAANVLPFAYVTLTTSGVESIVYVETNRIRSAQDNADSIDDLNQFRTETGARLETIDTQVTGLADRISKTAPLLFAAEVARDVANLKQRAGLPAAYSSYGSDPFLSLEQSDSDVFVVTGQPNNPAFLAKVMEGIRFADAQANTMQLALLNNDETRVQITNNLALPAYSEVLRISSEGRDDELSIAQYSVQTVNLVQRSVTRQRTRYGGYFLVCTNSAWWRSGQYDPAAGIFRRNGEVFEVDLGLGSGIDPNDYQHAIVRARQFWVDTFEEPYFDRVVNVSTASGSIIAQTFLNSQEAWVPSIGLFLTRKANADLRVLLTEVGDNGAPRYDKVIAQAVVAAADLKTYPEETRVRFASPVLLKRGVRYAIVPMSTGSHFFAITQNNKFAQGTLFTSTDGAWFQGDLLRDIAFNVYACRFVAPRVEVQLQPLTLALGIAAIDILADTIVPSGCTVSYEVKIDNVWRAFSGGLGADPLAGLPALLQFRVVFLGTVDLMPQIGFGSRSQVLLTRPRTDAVHISTVFTPPAAVKTITVTERLEGGFNPSYHTAAVKILYGAGYATTKTADAVETRAADDDPTVTIRKYVFTFATAITSFKIREEMGTDSALRCYHVAYRDWVALTT